MSRPCCLEAAALQQNTEFFGLHSTELRVVLHRDAPLVQRLGCLKPERLRRCFKIEAAIGIKQQSWSTSRPAIPQHPVEVTDCPGLRAYLRHSKRARDGAPGPDKRTEKAVARMRRGTVVRHQLPDSRGDHGFQVGRYAVCPAFASVGLAPNECRRAQEPNLAGRHHVAPQGGGRVGVERPR